MTLSQTFTAFTPEIWSPRITMFFKAKLACAPFFADYSSDVANGGDTIHIPKISNGFTAASVTTTAGAITSTNLSDTNTTLSVTSWMGVAYDISDLQYAQIMNSYNVKNKYAESMGYALAKKFDTDILALGANLTPSVGSSATGLLATSLEKAFGILTSNSVPKDECVLFLNPKTYWTRIMAIQKYYDASQFGKATLPFGVTDMLYGVPVIVTPQVPLGTAGTEGGYRNILVHKDAFAYAMGKLPGASTNGIRIQEKQSENLKVRFVGDIAYGVVTTNATGGVRIIDAD